MGKFVSNQQFNLAVAIAHALTVNSYHIALSCKYLQTATSVQISVLRQHAQPTLAV